MTAKMHPNKSNMLSRDLNNQLQQQANQPIRINLQRILNIITTLKERREILSQRTTMGIGAHKEKQTERRMKIRTHRRATEIKWIKLQSNRLLPLLQKQLILSRDIPHLLETRRNLLLLRRKLRKRRASQELPTHLNSSLA